MKKRKNYTSGFKTKVVLEALQERDTIQEIGKKYEVHPNQISTWKSQFLSGASSVFEKGVVKNDAEKEKVELFKKVGQLQMQVDFLKKSTGEIAKEDRNLKVDKASALSIMSQCELLDICRSSFYYITHDDSTQNQELMKLIDKQYMETPFFGVPRMTEYLRDLGHKVNPKRIRRLYRLMDLHALGPWPNTSKPHKGEGHTIYPYLLRDLSIIRPNQVWGMDSIMMQSVNGGGHHGGGIFINTLDQARFGLLFLNKGKWKEKQLISEKWISLATSPSKANKKYHY